MSAEHQKPSAGVDRRYSRPRPTPLVKSALKSKARLGLLLLRSIWRVRVRFARNLVLRFRRLRGIEFFIRSATAKDDSSGSEENQTRIFHAPTNNRRSPDFQRRCWFSELAKLSESFVSFVDLR